MIDHRHIDALMDLTDGLASIMEEFKYCQCRTNQDFCSKVPVVCNYRHWASTTDVTLAESVLVGTCKRGFMAPFAAATDLCTSQCRWVPPQRLPHGRSSRPSLAHVWPCIWDL